MDLDDILADELLKKDDEPVYEDDYVIVYKVLGEVETTSANYVKRVQLVRWKKKQTDKLDIDFRVYDKNKGRYKKGITFDPYEFNLLKKILENIDDTQSLN